MRPEIPPLTEDEIHELLAEDAWAQRNMLEGCMDDRHAHIDHRAAEAMRPGCHNTRGVLNLGEIGWDFSPAEEKTHSSWLLVGVGMVLAGLAIALLPYV